MTTGIIELTPLQQRQLKLLEETIAYYGEDPEGRRAAADSHGGNCYYEIDGRRCAVGRILTEDEMEIVRGEAWLRSAADRLPRAIVMRLDDTYGIGFLLALQQLHDDVGNWAGPAGGVGLSRQGQGYAKILRANVSKGVYGRGA